MIPTIVPQSHIQLKYAFGMNSMIPNSLSFIDDQRIIYIAGYHVVAYNIDDHSQNYFSGIEAYKCITSICLSPFRRFLAMAVSGEKPAIFVFDTMTYKKKKSLIYSGEFNIKEYTSLAFAPGQENKNLISLSGSGGDIILIYWQYDKSKPCASVKISQSSNLIINEIAFNPEDISFITVIGNKVFKEFQLYEQMDENNVKQFILKIALPQLNAPPDIQQTFVSHCWLSVEPKVIIANDIGQIIQLTNHCEYDFLLENSPYILQKKNWKVSCLIQSQQGFIIGGGSELEIFIYKYNGSNYYDIGYQLNVLQSNEIIGDINIKCICVPPGSEGRLYCSLSNNTIYGTKFKSEVSIFGEEQKFEQISLKFHEGPITAMDVCIRKPLIATVGHDKIIRIWNYQEKTIEVQRYFQEEASSLTIHPSGLHLVVGFSDKLKMMNIINRNNQIKPYKEIPFKNCKVVKYSNGGQYFATVNATSSSSQTINIFCSYTGSNPNNFIFKSSHTGQVRCLLWSRDDQFLVSCGTDGAIYAWKIQTDTVRVIESTNKGVKYSSLAMTNDNKLIYACGNDHALKEIGFDLPSEGNKRDIGVNASQICFPRSNKLLFVGIQDDNVNGAIRCYKYPLTGHSTSEYQAHDERGIECMRVTHDDQFLISAGKDGCLMVFEIKDKETRGQKLKDGFAKVSDEILITKQDLEDLKSAKEQSLQAYQDQMAAQVNILTLTNKDEIIKQLEEKQKQQKINEKKRYEKLQEQMNETKTKKVDEIADKKARFELAIQELEHIQQKRQSEDFQHFEELKKLKEKEKLEFEKDIEQDEAEYEQRKKELNDHYSQLLEQELNNVQQLQKELNDSKKEFEKSIKLIEHETYEEIQNLVDKNQRDIQILEEKERKLKGETSMTNKKIQAQKQDYEELQDQKKDYVEELNKGTKENADLKFQIEELKKKIQDKDRIIGEKERRIYDLKKRSQELEKFKFVLNHKIKELKHNIGPREDEIANMKKETNKMDQKLKKFNKINNTLGAVVDDLDSTQEHLKVVIKNKRTKIQQQNSQIKQYKDAVYSAVQLIQNFQKLQEQVTSLYMIHVKEKNIKKVEIDSDIKAEYISQKKYLEKSNAMLKKNLLKDAEIHKQDNIRVMRENVDLIKKINKIRKNIKDKKTTQKGKDDDQLIILSKKKEIEQQEKEVQRLQQELQKELDMIEEYQAQII